MFEVVNCDYRLVSELLHEMSYMTAKAKISDELVHKQLFEGVIIWPLALWPYPDRCKDLVFLGIFL